MNKSTLFAQDATQTLEVIAALNVKISQYPDLHWAALIDGAFDYPQNGLLPYEAGGINCYDVAGIEGLSAASPWLLPLHTSDVDGPILRQLLRHCKERPMLSFIASRLPIKVLSQQWQHLYWINDGDDQAMLLRFADTRILPALTSVLIDEQWAAFTAPLATWCFIARDGLLVDCELAPKDIIATPKISLTQSQLDTLLQAAEPDAVIDLLSSSMPEILPPELKPSQLYSLIDRCCALSESYGITTYSDIVSIAVAACLTDGKSIEDTRLMRLLQSKTWASGKLGEAIIDHEII